MRGIHHRLQHIQPPAGIAFQAHLEFRLDRVFFPLHIGGIKPGGDKKLRETVEGLRQVGRVDIEKVVGVLKRGKGVAGTAVLGDEFLVLRGIGVFVRTQEQHVLQEMREPAATLRVVATAHGYIQGRGRLDRVRVGNQQHFHLVGQGEQTVVVAVIGALDRLPGSGRNRRTGG